MLVQLELSGDDCQVRILPTGLVASVSVVDVPVQIAKGALKAPGLVPGKTVTGVVATLVLQGLFAIVQVSV